MKKAVILAAGLGERFGDLTKEKPKGLILLNGKPLLEYIISKVIQTGIKEIIIVLGHKGELIKDYLKDGNQFGIIIKYAFQEKIDGIRSSLLAAKELVGEDDFLLSYCDNIFAEDLNKLKVHFEEGSANAILAVVKHDEPTNKAIVVVDNERVSSLHSVSEDLKSIYVDAGIMCFPSTIFSYLESHDSYLDALNEFVEEQEVKIYILEKPWCNVNSVEDLEIAKNIIGYL